MVSPVPGCGTRREEDSLLTRCGDDQSGRACFLGNLCWCFVSVDASVLVVDLCALCPLLGVYFGTGGMDLSRVNTTAFVFTLHARRRRHYWRVGCCLRLCIFKYSEYKFISFLLLLYFTLCCTHRSCVKPQYAPTQIHGRCTLTVVQMYNQQFLSTWCHIRFFPKPWHQACCAVSVLLDLCQLTTTSQTCPTRNVRVVN